MARGEITNKLTVREFFKRFPDEATCLEHVMDVRFGLRHTCAKCGVVDSTFHRLENRKAYACAHCGDNLYPCAGTIFQDSRTALQIWFYAIFLFVATRHGVSGKELQRQLGVTYKCAYRMGIQIRKLMEKADGHQMLSGHVEADEALIGGRNVGAGKGQGMPNKVTVFGMKQRNGALVAKVIDGPRASLVRDVVLRHAELGTSFSTDESNIYNLLEQEEYWHGRVNHSAKEYARRDKTTGEFIHTNGIESFWKLFKDSVRSTHIHISPQHTQKYVSEFVYRSNHRSMGNAMFDALISAL